MRKRILVVGGARPNFIKIAPLVIEFNNYKDCFEVFLVHTGQHYDFEMSEIFFKNLRIPNPDIYLNVGSGSHAVQTAKIMTAFEKVVVKEKPDLIIVVGDVNSTLACSLVASKLNIKIAHVEAGLRSFDRIMPEEINRIVTDSISDYLFVSEDSGLKNLRREGINSAKVHFVGNIMIDTLLANLNIINQSKILEKLQLTRNEYSVMTMHRPGNVDSKEALSEIVDILNCISENTKIVYPVHPRPKKTIKQHNLLRKLEHLDNLILIEPLGYIDFIRLVKDSVFVLTDSGGIQEETTALKVPCLTLRENTERPVTTKKGTNHLVGRDKNAILKLVDNILSNNTKKGEIPELWDGKTAKRIVEILKRNS
jgi:UDP-N-acetylglucosamine 2-epimerase (non-hydrolysing)